MVLPQVIQRGKLCVSHILLPVLNHLSCQPCRSGLKVTEVAHDHQVQVKEYVTQELHLKNSSDTWHGN